MRHACAPVLVLLGRGLPCTRLRGSVGLGLVALALLGLGSPLVSIRLFARPPLLLQRTFFRANQSAEDLPGVRSSFVLRASRHLARRDQVAQLQLRQVVGRRHPWIVQESEQIASLVMLVEELQEPLVVFVV